MTNSMNATINTAQLCLGLLLCTLSLTARAVQPEVTQFDLLSLQLTHAETKQFNGYQLSTSVGNNASNGFVFGKGLHLPSLSELKKGTFWTTSIRWNYSNDNLKSSLSPRLRVESKESRIEFNPIKHAASITWRRELK